MRQTEIAGFWRNSYETLHAKSTETSALRHKIRRFDVAQAGLGIVQTVGWASSYYLPAVLANPMAAEFGLSPVWVFGAFSGAMVVSSLIGPRAGARIDHLGGRGVLAVSNLIFATGLAGLALAQGPASLILA